MTGRTSALVLAATLATQGGGDPAAAHQPETRPNILWITSEDNAPSLGAYGDRDARTPVLDAFARRGLRYRTVWSTAPVCAPARTALITGMYPQSIGGEHMRSLVRLPEGMRMFPALLRDAGYYTTNNSKQDYNVMEAGDGRSPPAWRDGGGFADVATVGVWDDSSATAHWRNRRDGQPFFAVFNLDDTHESRIQKKPAPKTHDPAAVRVPASMPDIPEVRADWAAYHDNMTVMDGLAGRLLAELDAAGLAGDTIVFYFGDNGPGLPRHKRFVYDAGLHVPLVVHVPAKFRHLAPEGYAEGAASDRLLGFVDLAPTVLSLAGLRPPAHMQGRAFMGAAALPAPPFVFGARARMDERYDLQRAVRDQRYVYIRSYMPHRAYGQYLAYAALMPGWQAWKRLYEAGRLRPPQSSYWEPKPAEELYDLTTDADEVTNLATRADHRPALERLRAALDAHARDVRDLGFLPEYMLHRVPVPYTFGHDARAYDAAGVSAAATRASDPAVDVDAVRRDLASRDPAIRYWASLGITVRGRTAVAATEAALVERLADDAPGPRIAAAEALARYGTPEHRTRALATLLALAAEQEVYVALLALNSLVHIGELPADVRTAVAALPRDAGQSNQRGGSVAQTIDQIAKGLR
jgi:arylsulfatase A-like enzyme